MNRGQVEELIGKLFKCNDDPDSQIDLLQKLDDIGLSQVGLCLLAQQERIMSCSNTALRSVWAITSVRAVGEKVGVNEIEIPFRRSSAFR